MSATCASFADLASAPAPIALPHVWQLQRRSLITPRSLFVGMGLLALASVVLGALLARSGHVLGALFFGGHAAGLVFATFARAVHMADREEVSLRSDALVVRRFDGLSVATHRLAPLRTRVEMEGRGTARRFLLVDDQESVPVGRWLPPLRRHLAVQEITVALLALHAQAAANGAGLSSQAPAATLAPTPAG